MLGFEICDIVKTCIEHDGRKQNFDPGHYCRIMFPWMTHIFWPYSHALCTAIVFLSPQLLPYFDHISMPYVQQYCLCLHKTPYSIQTRLIQHVFAAISPFKYLRHFGWICRKGGFVAVTLPQVYKLDLKLATQLKHALDMYIKETKLWCNLQYCIVAPL